MLGILTHGDNHFIVRGPLPSREQAIALVRQWSVIQIGGQPEPSLAAWRISTKEFREDLMWAVAVPGDRPMNPAVVELLGELRARGVKIEEAVAS